MQKKVAVFCASSHQIDDIYTRDARSMGTLFAQNNLHVLYGGGGKGLMGAVADAVLEADGNITGIIPHFMVELEWAHPAVTNMVGVETMSIRKQMLVKDVDAVVVLPGSIGTFEETMEVLSMKKLGMFFAPVIFLNTNAFYEPLFALMQKAADEKFMRQMHTQLWEVAETPEEVIGLIEKTPNWPKDSIRFADMPHSKSDNKG